jgi:hypothetical protein
MDELDTFDPYAGAEDYDGAELLDDVVVPDGEDAPA